MVEIEVVYILSRDDIDLGVPIVVKLIQGGKLRLLLSGKMREIFDYCLHVLLVFLIILQSYEIIS